MNSGLISDFAERASKVLCDGAISAATETVPSTVTVWDNSPTLSAMETFSVPPAASLSPVRRLVAKLGAVTSIEYTPTGRPVTENLPSVPLVVWRAEPFRPRRHGCRRVGRQKCPMPLSFPKTGNPAEIVGQVGNLRRVGNPPEP